MRIPPRVRFIVNADDLGASETINRAVFDGIDDGVVSSATLMATGEAVDAAIRTAARFPSASFGVHMNVTEHQPLTRNPALAPLLDANGLFRRDAVYEVRWTAALIAAVGDEWTEQVRRIQRGGIAVSHLDSHHHVHTIPALFPALKSVQRRTGLRRVRGTWSIYEPQREPSAALRFSKRVWWWSLRHVYATQTTSEFTDFLVFQHAVADGSYAPRRWPTAIELMVHPGGDLERDPEESATLRSGWLKTLPVPGELVPYTAI